MVRRIPPEVVRADALRAHRLHAARELAGHDDDPDVEAEAGARLEAAWQCDLADIADIARAWARAHAKR